VSLLLALGAGAGAFYDAPNTPDGFTSASEQLEVTGNLTGHDSLKVSKLMGEWKSVEPYAAYNTPENLQKGGQKKACSALAEALMEHPALNITSLTLTDSTYVLIADGNTECGIYSINGAALLLGEHVLNARQSGKKLHLAIPYNFCNEEAQQALRHARKKVSTEGLYVGITLKRK